MRRPFGGVEPDRGPAPDSERAPSPDRGASGEGPELAPAYARAGVRLEAKPEAVRRIRDLAASTRRSGWLGNIGSFGGFFDLDAAVGPASGRLLVAGADGVGTKLKLAIQLDRHDTVGQDAVAMCVNDILCHGAEPLFFLDYLATGRLDPERVAEIVGGVVEGCRLAGCALIGGETAEMPGMYEPGEYDLAGFAVGAVAPERLIDGRRVRAGDRLVGLASSGPHSNGFSLIRRIVSDRQLALDRPLDELGGRTLGEALLEPTRIYVRTVLALLQEEFDLRGIAHITGGGLVENLPRALGGLGFELEARSWEVPAVLRLLAAWGDLGDEEMVRVFNCGLGLVLAVPDEQAEALRARAEALGERAWLVGEVTEAPGARIGTISGARPAIAAPPAGFDPAASAGRRGEAAPPVGRVRLAVLASGRGSNLKAILEASRAVDYPAEVAVVISDRKDAPALEIARAYGVPTEVVELRPSRPESTAGRAESAPGPIRRTAFEGELAERVQAHGVDLVCLAGFMRLLGPTFLDRFPGRVLNIHPSLLPSFPGLHAQRQALEHGVAVSGCTVHLVDEGLDSGPIILQRAVPVLPDDTEESLSARILAEEHRAYPEAIRLMAEGRLRIEGRRVVIGRAHIP